MKWHWIFYHFSLITIVQVVGVFAVVPKYCTVIDENTWSCIIMSNNVQINCKSIHTTTYSPRIVQLKINTIDQERFLLLFESAEMCNINRLHIEANHIPSNTVTRNLKSLEVLIIQNSGQNLGTESVKSLNHLFSGLNRLQKVKIENFKVTLWSKEIFQSCTEIKEIDLKSLEIETIDFESFINCKKLITLIIRMNRIPRLLISSFYGLPELTKLSLESNEIGEIFTNGNSWEGVEKLKELDLSDNKIVELTPKLFFGLKYLERLSLKNNQLNSIALETFLGLDELTVLDLQNNLRLLWFDLNVLSPVKRSLTRLFIDSTIIQCLHDKHFLPEYRQGIKETLQSITPCNNRPQLPRADDSSDKSTFTMKSINGDLNQHQPMVLIITVTTLVTIIVFLSILFIYYCVVSKSKIKKLKLNSVSNSCRYSRTIDNLSNIIIDGNNNNNNFNNNTTARHYQTSEGTYGMFTNSRNENPRSETTSMIT